MGTLNSMNKCNEQDMPEPYLTEDEKHMVLEKVRSICYDEFNSTGALLNRRLVTSQDLPDASCIKINTYDRTVEFTELPEYAKSLYFVIDGRKIFVFLRDPSVMKIYNPNFQCVEIHNPEIGKSYFLDDLGMDLSKVKLKSGEHSLFNYPWSLDTYREIKGSRIEVSLLRDGYVHFRTVNVEDIPSIKFRRSKLYDNSLDLVIDYGEQANAGDYKLQGFEDGLTICDPILHSALKQQASIYMIGTPYEGKYVYNVSFRYVENLNLKDTFVDADKNMGQSNVEYNRSLFSEV